MKGIGNPFIKKRINVVTVLFGIFFLFLIVHRFFIEMGVPSATKYLLDVFNIIFFMYALLKTRKISNYDKYYVICYVGIIFLWTVSFIMNITYTDSDVAFYIFDIRN